MKEKSEKNSKEKQEKTKKELIACRGDKYNKNDFSAGGQQEVDIAAALPEDLCRWGEINCCICLELFRWLVDDVE